MESAKVKQQKLKKLSTALFLIFVFLFSAVGCSYAADMFSSFSKEAPSDAYYDAEQAKLKLVETKIVSPMFQQTVGRMLAPEGWDVQVMDLMVGTESIACPNAIVVSVTSPEKDCQLVYVSKREFKQVSAALDTFTFATEDDAYDFSELYHTLNYREADACCDYMAENLFGDGCRYVRDIKFTKEEKENVKKAKQTYQESVQKIWSDAASAGIVLGDLAGSDCTISKREYKLDNTGIYVFAGSCGFRIYQNFMGAETNTILWCMPFVFGIRAVNIEKYQELFDVFCKTASVSEEYAMMRDKNAERMVTEYIRLRDGGGGYTFGDSGGYDDIQDETIDSGDTYSALDGWDDVIRDQTDYTTGDGTHVKVSTDYSHVFEMDNGDIYATNYTDVPPGGIELDPTQIGY